MARSENESSGTKVTNIADARKDRLDKTSIAYGRRKGDDAGGPNLGARLDELKDRPSVRPVREGRAGGRRFDREKVDRIKAELIRGDYKIDSLKVADMFIDHERHS